MNREDESLPEVHVSRENARHYLLNFHWQEKTIDVLLAPARIRGVLIPIPPFNVGTGAKPSARVFVEDDE